MDEIDVLARSYAVTVVPDGEGGYLARVPDFRGVIAGGDTPAEALACAYDGIASLIEVCRADGRAIPEPSALLAAA